MQTIKSTFAILFLLTVTLSCNKDDSDDQSTAAENTLTFKGAPITFNSLTINEGPNATSEVILTSTSNFSMIFYCKYMGNEVQTNLMDAVTYTADATNYLPVNNYPDLTVRGYVNSDNQYVTTSGEVKIKLNDIGNQNIEFINLKLNTDSEEQTLNGSINLPKS